MVEAISEHPHYTMSTLTLHQPWASLIKDGRKTIETRSWTPPCAIVGEHIAIHAGRTIDAKACLKFGYDSTTIERGQILCTALVVCAFVSAGIQQGEDGALQATVRTINGLKYPPIEHIPQIKSTKPEIAIHVDEYGDFSEGRILWILSNAQVIEPPVKATGKQGL